MRSGHLLAEESPSVLLSMYKSNSLEEVFLKLSRLQAQKHDVSQVNFSNNISLHAMTFGSKMDKPSSSQDGDVIGLNFYQSREVLINDLNGSISAVSKLTLHSINVMGILFVVYFLKSISF